MTKGGLVHMNTLRGCRNGETWEAMDQGLHTLWPYKWVTSHKYTDRTWLWEGSQSNRAITFSRCGCYKWEGERERKDTRWQWPIMSWLAHWERKVPSRRQMGKLVRQGWSLSGFGAYPRTSSCRPGLPWTHRDAAASVPWVLVLKECATLARQKTQMNVMYMYTESGTVDIYEALNLTVGIWNQNIWGTTCKDMLANKTKVFHGLRAKRITYTK